MTYHRKLTALSVLLTVVALVTVIPASANAATLIDPGNVGDTFASRTASFSDFNGTTFAGQVLELDFVFDAMKHVEIIDTSTNEYRIGVSLSHTDSGNSTGVAALADNPIEIPISHWNTTNHLYPKGLLK